VEEAQIGKRRASHTGAGGRICGLAQKLLREMREVDLGIAGEPTGVTLLSAATRETLKL